MDLWIPQGYLKIKYNLIIYLFIFFFLPFSSCLSKLMLQSFLDGQQGNFDLGGWLPFPWGPDHTLPSLSNRQLTPAPLTEWHEPYFPICNLSVLSSTRGLTGSAPQIAKLFASSWHYEVTSPHLWWLKFLEPKISDCQNQNIDI